MIRRLLLTLAALAGLACSTPTFGQALVSAIPVASCNSKSYTLGVPSALTMTTGGNLCDTGSGGGGGSNAAAGPTGSAPPASASYNGLNVGGTLRGQTGVNPSGSVYAAQTDLTSVGGTSIALGQTTMSASLPVAFASNQSALTVAQATAANLNMTDISDVAQGSTTSGQVGPLVQGSVTTSSPTYSNGQTSPLRMNTAGSLQVYVGTGGVVTTPLGGVAAIVSSSNGWTPLRLSALTNSAVAIKGSTGQIGMLQCYNPNASQVYIQIYNIVSTSVTVGTSTPTLSIAIAPTSTGGFVMAFPGVQFATAISAAATTTATGGSAPSTAADCNVVYD